MARRTARRTSPARPITIYPSTLGVSCPRFHWLRARRRRDQTYFDGVSETGVVFEQAVSLAMREGRDRFLVDNTEYRIPSQILAQRWTIQREVCHDIGEDARIHGYVDLYSDEANWVVDIKSAYDTSTTRWRWQMGAYALPFWRVDSSPRVSIYFARWGIVADIDPLAPEEVEDRVRGLVAEIAADREPKGRGGVACWYCPYAPSCPDAPPIDEEPEQMLRELLKAEARVKALRANLRAYVSARGEVVIEDARAEFAPVTTMDVDVSQLHGTLTRLGIDPFAEGYLTANRRKVEKLARDRDEVAQLISIRTGRSRFAVRRTGAGEEDEDE